MITRELKKSNDNLIVHGKLIINLSTNLSAPTNRPAAQPVVGGSPGTSFTSPTTNGASSSILSPSSVTDGDPVNRLSEPSPGPAAATVLTPHRPTHCCRRLRTAAAT